MMILMFAVPIICYLFSGNGYFRPLDCHQKNQDFLVLNRLRKLNQNASSMFYTKEEQNLLYSKFKSDPKNEDYLPGSFVFKVSTIHPI